MNDTSQSLLFVSAAILVYGAIGPSIIFGANIKTRVITLLSLYLFVASLYTLNEKGAVPLVNLDPYYYDSDLIERSEKARKILSVIPRHASLTASQGTYTHLHHNPNAYLFKGRGKFPFSQLPFDYVILDTKANLSHPLTRTELEDEVKTLLLGQKYGLMEHADGLFIFKKGYTLNDNLKIFAKHFATWPAWKAPKIVGSNEADTTSIYQNARSAKEGITPKGTLVYGPYIRLPAGDYVAIFRMKAKAGANDKIAMVDVANDIGKGILAELLLTGEDFSGGGKWSAFHLPFSVKDNEKSKYLELRVEYFGVGDLLVDMTSIEPVFLR